MDNMTIANLMDVIRRRSPQSLLDGQGSFAQGDEVLGFYDDPSLEPDGPMNDENMPDFSEPDINGRLSGLLQQGAPNNQPVIADLAGALPAPATEPKNYFQRTTLGNKGPMVSMDSAVATPGDPRGYALDYSRPVEVAGVGKGFPIKGDPTRYVMNDGRIVRTGVDRAAEVKAARDAEEMALKRMVAEAQVRRLDRQGVPKGGEQQTGGMPSDLKLEKDQFWNPETQRVEAAPGSKLYIKQREQLADDAGYTQTVADTSDSTLKKIDQLLGDKEKFSSAFGYGAKYTTQMLPSGRDATALLDSIKADMANIGLARMRTGGSIGQITEKEWKLLQDQIASLDNNMSEGQARKTLEGVRSTVELLKKRTGEKFESQWSDHPQFKGVTKKEDSGPPRVSSLNEAMKLKSGTRFIDPNGVERVRP